MGAVWSFASLLLIFAVGAWGRSADTDHVEPNSFHYGGWRPIRGRSLYARNTSNVHSDPRDNLYVVVPTALINLAQVPVHRPIANNEIAEESQVREERVRFPEPHPDAEPSPDLTLLRPKHLRVPLRGEREHVEESQNREIYLQNSVRRPPFQDPMPIAEPDVSHSHSPFGEDPRNFHPLSTVRHPQHLEPHERFKPSSLNLRPGHATLVSDEHHSVIKQNVGTVGVTHGEERDPAELEAQGSRHFGIRIRYQKKQSEVAVQQLSKETSQESIKLDQLPPRPSNLNQLRHHHFVAHKELKHHETVNKPEYGRPSNIPHTPKIVSQNSEVTYTSAKQKDTDLSEVQGKASYIATQHKHSLRLPQQLTTANSLLQHHAPPTRFPQQPTTPSPPAQQKQVLQPPFNIPLNHVVGPNTPPQAEGIGPFYKKPIGPSQESSVQESIFFQKYLQPVDGNRDLKHPEPLPLPSQAGFQRTVSSHIQFQEHRMNQHPLPLYNGQNLTNTLKPSGETYFPPLLPSASNKVIITNDIFGQPLIAPPSPQQPVKADLTTDSTTCSSKCEPTIASFGEASNKGTLIEKLEHYQAGALFRLVPVQEESLIKLISTGGLYTLFLPSDEAVNRLPMQLIEAWRKNPQALLFALLNHAIPHKETLDSLRQKRILYSKAKDAVLFVNNYRNDTVTVNGRRLIYANIDAPQGGMVHIIDGMLYPAANKDIISVLIDCDRFDGFLNLAKLSDIASLLRRDGPYTLFLPSNDALMKIENEDMVYMRSNITVMRDFLLYHIVEGLHYSGDLLDGQYLPTLYSGSSVKAGVRADSCYRRLVEANNSPIFRSDIPARNGVIHVVDWVIRPTDLDWCDGVILP